MTNHEQLVYMAGIVDGEGCLSTDRDGDRFKARLSIAGSHYPTMLWIRMIFGGSVYKCLPRKNSLVRSKKISWSWVLTCNQATELIKELLPYIKIKQKEAVVFLRLRGANHKERRLLSDDLKQLKRE